MTPPHTASLTPTQTSWSLLGITIVTVMIATALRMRVPAIASSLQRRPGLRGSTGFSTLLRHVTGALAWAAFLLYALAGVAAAGTFIGRFVLWLSHLIDRWFNNLAGMLPGIGPDLANLGVGVITLVVFWRGLHLLGNFLEGRAHHGGEDGLVFLGPVLFPLVPGWFGIGAAHVYAWLSAHVGTVAAHLL